MKFWCQFKHRGVAVFQDWLLKLNKSWKKFRNFSWFFEKEWYIMTDWKIWCWLKIEFVRHGTWIFPESNTRFCARRVPPRTWRTMISSQKSTLNVRPCIWQPFSLDGLMVVSQRELLWCRNVGYADCISRVREVAIHSCVKTRLKPYRMSGKVL